MHMQSLLGIKHAQKHVQFNSAVEKSSTQIKQICTHISFPRLNVHFSSNIDPSLNASTSCIIDVLIGFALSSGKAFWLHVLATYTSSLLSVLRLLVHQSSIHLLGVTSLFQMSPSILCRWSNSMR